MLDKRWIPAAVHLLGLCLSSCLFSVTAAAQDAAPAFTEVLDIELVNVEVWVTDRKGEPVHGLSVDDFRLFEDGDPVEVEFFAEVGAPAPTPRRQPAPGRTEWVEDPAAPTLDVPPTLVVYLDEARLQIVSRRRVSEDVRSFLAEGNVPEDRVLVLRHRAKGLEVMVPLGSTFAEVDAALVRLVEEGPPGSSIDQARRLTYSRLRAMWDQSRQLASGTNAGISGRAGNANVSGGASACDSFISPASNEVQVYAAESLQRIADSLSSLAEAASLLAGVDGAKTMLYLSDGLETDPALEMVSFIEALCPNVRLQRPNMARRDDLSRAFLALTSHANANRVTIYSMQASGLTPSYLGVAEQETISTNGANKVFDDQVRFNQRDGLLELALETGGRAIYNQNNLSDELVQMGREMRSYYSLAYTPPAAGDGLEHKVEVKLDGDTRAALRETLGRGIELRHRRAYRDKSSEQRTVERLQTTSRLGVIKNVHGARLGAGTLREGAEGKKAKYTLPLHILVPANRVTFLPGASGSAARLRVHISSTDADGRLIEFRQKSFRFDPPPAAGDDTDQLLDLAVEVELADGMHVVAAAVRDEASGETSYLATSLEVGAPSGGE